MEKIKAKLNFRMVASHRREAYEMGEIPNEYAKKHSGGPILMVNSIAVVHQKYLSVAVFGWCATSIPYLIEYFRIELNAYDKVNGLTANDGNCSIWDRYYDFFDGKEYTADDGKKYKINDVFIEAGFFSERVLGFCSCHSRAKVIRGFSSRCGISSNKDIFTNLGIQSTKKNWHPWTSNWGFILGYHVRGDYYKDVNYVSLSRDWNEGNGRQEIYHFNCPSDISDLGLKELTEEHKRKRIDSQGNEATHWHHPSNANTDLWDLLLYGYAAVDIITGYIMESYNINSEDAPQFWRFIEENELFFEDPNSTKKHVSIAYRHHKTGIEL